VRALVDEELDGRGRRCASLSGHPADLGRLTPTGAPGCLQVVTAGAED
jgi:hypothetical protein